MIDKHVGRKKNSEVVQNISIIKDNIPSPYKLSMNNS